MILSERAAVRILFLVPPAHKKLLMEYDHKTNEAMGTFIPPGLISLATFMKENAERTATIDPSHMVFKFSGKDVKGKTMDPTSDEFAGAAELTF